MNKLFLLSLAIGLTPLCVNAQDDMYFTPKKDKTINKTAAYHNPRPVYHSGSDRDVDEYNRRGFSSSYTSIDDTLAADAIDFDGNTPDSLYVAKQKGKYSKGRYGKYHEYSDDEDYDYYWRARRFDDDFFWTYDPWYYDDPWYRSYYGYYGSYYTFGWGRPWRYGYYSYYGGWYDPWYYSYSRWYDPWYYGWNRPYWGMAVTYRPSRPGGVTGTSNHGWVGRPGSAGGSFGHGPRNNTNPSLYRGSNSASSRNTDTYNRQITTRRNTDFSNHRRNNDNFSQSRNNDTFRRGNDNFSQSNYRNSPSFEGGSFNRGGNFSSGGNRGGGGGFSGGGGRSGGGGHFGGRR